MKESLVFEAKRWLDSVRGVIVSPHWAKDRDGRRWRALVRITDEELQRLHWAVPDENLLNRFAQKDERWRTIATQLLVHLEVVDNIPVRFPAACGEIEAELEAPELQRHLRLKQRRFFLGCCYKMAVVANDPGLGLAALNQIE